jgi:hypothetical protein
VDSKLEELLNFRDALAAHDRSLEQSLKRTLDIGLQGQIPLRTLFDNIRREYAELIPKFEVYGQIPVVKQQVAHALAIVEGKIRTSERQLAEYAQRNRLSSHIHHTRHLIGERIREGDAVRDNSNSPPRNVSELVARWRTGTQQTLKNVFVSPWNGDELERIARAAENSTNATDPAQFVLEKWRSLSSFA